MHQITVGDVIVDVVRKEIKNLHLAVYPPDGRVRIAAPYRLNDEALRLFTISRLGWIRRQQAKFASQERHSPREYVSGESHYFRGKRYRLRVIEQPGPGRIKRHARILELVVPKGSDGSRRQRILHTWYRVHLRAEIAPLIARWEPVMGVKVAEWGIKQMKTKWGTCNREAARLWFNLELAKKSLQCLEYVVVHEMVHLLERQHNDRFISYMDRFLPHWRLYRAELNHAPLGDWESTLGISHQGT